MGNTPNWDYILFLQDVSFMTGHTKQVHHLIMMIMIEHQIIGL